MNHYIGCALNRNFQRLSIYLYNKEKFSPMHSQLLEVLPRTPWLKQRINAYLNNVLLYYFCNLALIIEFLIFLILVPLDTEEPSLISATGISMFPSDV